MSAPDPPRTRVQRRGICLALLLPACAASLLLIATASAAPDTVQPPDPLPSEPPQRWGNALYVNLALGQSHSFLGKQVRLLAVTGDHCTVAVDAVTTSLRMARRDRPTVVNGVRLFLADTGPVARLTTSKDHPLTHAAITRDAFICMSDPAQPLLDPARFTFPISRAQGYQWTMDEDSGMFAYLSPARSHEGIDLNLHEARGSELHALVAIEDATVRWVAQGNKNEACILLESSYQPGLYYVYQHVNRDKVYVQAEDQVKRGQPLGHIWGDGRWGHLHFTVGAGPSAPDYAHRYQHVLNCFPQLFELWHDSLDMIAPPATAGQFRFAPEYWVEGGRRRLHAFADTVGYGWLLGDWCAAGKVEFADDKTPRHGQSARLSKVMHSKTTAAATNPEDWFDFEVVVQNGSYRVKAEVGDAYTDTWQRLQFEGVEAGIFELPAGELRWTPETTATIEDGRLTVRLHLKDTRAIAGLRRLDFRKVK